MITIEQFGALELRVATVRSAEPHPNADRLLVLRVDLGGEERQLVAGIRAHYTPEELVGKQIVVVTNLQPATLRGVESQGMLLAFSVTFCFALAWMAALVNLAPIVGAFAAGLVLDEVHFKPFDRGGEELLVSLKPLSAILTPIFFVLMGLRVDFRSFVRADIVAFAIALTFVAILGKQVCSLVVVERGINRLAVGLGMIPRGEVGLIFAGIGSSLILPNAQGVLEPVILPSTFAAVVVMVVVTTIVTPPVLKWAMARPTRVTRLTSPTQT